MIIFLYGEDTFRSREKLRELKAKFLHDVDPHGDSLVVVNGETSTMSLINEKVAPSSLLAIKRMIVIEDIFRNKSKNIFSEIVKYFRDKKNDDNIIIFLDSAVKKNSKTKKNLFIDAAGREQALTKDKTILFEYLGKQKYAQEFSLLSNTEVSAWTKRETEKRGGAITHQAASLLASLVGSDLWQVNNEIDKLLSFKKGLDQKLTDNNEKIQIDIQDVEKLVHGQLDENIFAFTDALSNKNKAQAIRLFSEQLEAELADSYLLNMIIRQFKILLQIRDALDNGHTPRKINNIVKLHPFVVQKGISQVRNFSAETLKDFLNKLVEIDYKMKTGQGDATTMISALLVNM